MEEEVEEASHPLLVLNRLVISSVIIIQPDTLPHYKKLCISFVVT